MDERTLVCGSTGFIGRNLVKALGEVKKSEGDLRKYENCQKAVKDVDTVYMVAGITGGVGLLAEKPLAMVTDNVILHANMFKACNEAGVKRIICMSSTTGYPERPYAIKEDEYFSGEVIPGYYNPGTTRRFIEKLGGMHKDLSVIFIRCAGAYGPGDDYSFDHSHVVAASIRKVAERHRPLKIWGDGKDVRDATHIDDLVRALILCKDLTGHHAINIGQGEGMSIFDIVSLLCSHADLETTFEFDNRPSIMRLRILDIHKAKELIGWEPTISMEHGLCRTLDWYTRESQ